MQASQLIDNLIEQVLHMPATDAENPARRIRVLQLTQEIVDEFCHQDFSWMKSSMVLDLLATDNGANAVPWDFMELGPEGYVKQVGYDDRLIERPSREMVEAIALGSKAGILTRFALGNIHGASATTPLQLLTDPPSNDLQLLMYYKRHPPFIMDGGGLDGLNEIPAAYHYPVIYNGVKWRLLDEEGDMERAGKAESKYEEARARAIKVDRRNKTTVTQLPRNAAGRGMY